MYNPSKADAKKLFVTNITLSSDEAHLYWIFQGTDGKKKRGIKNITMKVANEKKCAVVEFETEEDAYSAYESLKHNDVKNHEKCLNVNFYNEKTHKELNPDANIYVRSLPSNINEKKLQEGIVDYLTEAYEARGIKKSKRDLMPYSIKIGMSATKKKLKYAYVQFIDVEDARLVLSGSKELSNRIDPGSTLEFMPYHKENKILYVQSENRRGDIKPENLKNAIEAILARYPPKKILCQEQNKIVFAFVELDSEESAKKVLDGENLNFNEQISLERTDADLGITVRYQDLYVKFAQTDHRSSPVLLTGNLDVNVSEGKLKSVLDEVFPGCVKRVEVKRKNPLRSSAIIDCFDTLKARNILMQCKTDNRLLELYINGKVLISYFKEKTKKVNAAGDLQAAPSSFNNFQPMMDTMKYQTQNAGFISQMQPIVGPHNPMQFRNPQQMPTQSHAPQGQMYHAQSQPPAHMVSQQMQVFQGQMPQHHHSQQHQHVNPQRLHGGQNYPGGPGGKQQRPLSRDIPQQKGMKPQMFGQQQRPRNNNNRGINGHLFQNTPQNTGTYPNNIPKQQVPPMHGSQQKLPGPQTPNYPQNLSKMEIIKKNIHVYKDAKTLDEKTKEDLRNVLGEQLFKLVPQHMHMNDSQNKYAAKITGMLIDFDVFEVDDILGMIEDPSELENRVQ